MSTLRKKYHELGNKINNALLFVGTVKKDIVRFGMDDPRLIRAVKDCVVAEEELMALGRELDALKSLTYRIIDPNKPIGKMDEEIHAGNKDIRLLFVDDEGQLCDLLKRSYDAKGFQTATATTFAQARWMIREMRPHILVLDLYLDQGMEGVDILRFAKQQQPGIKCLVVSREFDEGRLQVVRELGADETLRKPVTADELESKINGLVSAVRG